MANKLEYGVSRNLPTNYIDQLVLAISQVTLAQVATVAATDLDRSRRVVSIRATPERLSGLMTELGATNPRFFDKKHKPLPSESKQAQPTPP